VIINDPDYPAGHLRYYENEKVASVGGPSLIPGTDSFFQ